MSALGYRPSATLSLWTELKRQASRRRTQLSLGFMVLLPLIVLLAAPAFAQIAQGPIAPPKEPDPDINLNAGRMAGTGRGGRGRAKPPARPTPPSVQSDEPKS